MAISGNISDRHSVSGALKKSSGGGGGGLVLNPAEVGDIPVVATTQSGAAKTYNAVKYSWDTLPDKPFGEAEVLMSYTYGQEGIDSTEVPGGMRLIKLSSTPIPKEDVLGKTFNATVLGESMSAEITEQDIIAESVAYRIAFNEFSFCVVLEENSQDDIPPTPGVWVPDYSMMAEGVDLSDLKMEVVGEAQKIPGDLVDIRWDDIADRPFGEDAVVMSYAYGQEVIDRVDRLLKLSSTPIQIEDVLGGTFSVTLQGRSMSFKITEQDIRDDPEMYEIRLYQFSFYVVLKEDFEYTPGVWVPDYSMEGEIDGIDYSDLRMEVRGTKKVPADWVDIHWDDIKNKPFSPFDLVVVDRGAVGTAVGDSKWYRTSDIVPEPEQFIGKRITGEGGDGWVDTTITADMIRTEAPGVLYTVYVDYRLNFNVFTSGYTVDGVTLDPGIYVYGNTFHNNTIIVYDFYHTPMAWSENDTDALGYIRDRTHYTIKQPREHGILTFDGNLEGSNVWYKDDGTTLPIILLSEEIHGRDSWAGQRATIEILADDGTTTQESEVVSPDNITELNGFGYAVGQAVMVLEYPMPISIRRADGNATNSEIPAGTWGNAFTYNGGTAYPVEVNFLRNTDDVITLDDKYLSDNIVRRGLLLSTLAPIMQQVATLPKTVNGVAPDEDGNITIESATVEDVLAALPTWEGGSY